jgi:3-hydroxyisobutyrate dehydrogenase-like beta-hydroxyacid dehydrogenase
LPSPLTNTADLVPGLGSNTNHAVVRKLTFCVAGPASAKERARPLLEAMGAERIVDFGEDIGAGSATKLVGNFLIISGFVALQEAFDVCAQAGSIPNPLSTCSRPLSWRRLAISGTRALS